MDLSKAERLILRNQYEILKRVDPDSAERCEKLIEILSWGYKALYWELDQWMTEEMEESDGLFVFDVLDMYTALECFYQDNPGSDVATRPLARFRGFDGNNESRLFGFAVFLKNDHKFRGVLGAEGLDLNSHAPSVPAYSRMLGAWKQMGQPIEVDEEQTAAIVDEAIDPSR